MVFWELDRWVGTYADALVAIVRIAVQGILYFYVAVGRAVGEQKLVDVPCDFFSPGL